VQNDQETEKAAKAQQRAAEPQRERYSVLAIKLKVISNFKKAYGRLLFVGVTRGSNKVNLFTDPNDMVQPCVPYDTLPSLTKITGGGHM
jgi:hypothetical protein